MNGHTHTLNQYTIDNSGYYITTGAGSLVDTDDQSTPLTSRKAAGVKIVDLSYNDNHTYQTVWNMKVAGYTSHSFNFDYTHLTTNFIFILKIHMKNFSLIQMNGQVRENFLNKIKSI